LLHVAGQVGKDGFTRRALVDWYGLSQVGIRSPYGVATLHLVYDHPEKPAVHHVESHRFVSLVSEPGHDRPGAFLQVDPHPC
jgi:hypothetical protein